MHCYYYVTIDREDILICSQFVSAESVLSLLQNCVLGDCGSRIYYKGSFEYYVFVCEQILSN